MINGKFLIPDIAEVKLDERKKVEVEVWKMKKMYNKFKMMSCQSALRIESKWMNGDEIGGLLYIFHGLESTFRS